jgi:hypothetical protein
MSPETAGVESGPAGAWSSAGACRVPAGWALPRGSPQAAALVRLLARHCPGPRPRVESLHGYLVVWPARLVRAPGCSSPAVPGVPAASGA